MYIPACRDAVVYLNFTGTDLHRNIFARFHLSAYRYVAISHRCIYILARRDAVSNIDSSFANLQRYVSIFGFYGFFNAYITFDNRNFHIVFSNHTAFSVISYRYVTLIDSHGYVIAGLHVATYRYVAFGHNCCMYIPACRDAVVYLNFTGTDLHRNIFARFHLSAYRYVAISHRCIYILARRDAVSNIDSSFANLQRYVSIFGFYGFFNAYITFDNRNFHIVFSDYTAFSVHAYCDFAVIDLNRHTVARIHVAANR